MQNPDYVRYRKRRFPGTVVEKDQRAAFERDRDRILYCSAFRRLAGVTQVASAEEGHLFHNRLTHSMKVAQIGLRLAQKLCHDQPKVAKVLNIDPNVVEAVCFAHDLGHPPFGHVGEHELNNLVMNENQKWYSSPGDPDGFEGNAQTFRILTRLAIRFPDHDGLSLTVATLSASIKYPWFRDISDPQKIKIKKWGAYTADAEAFQFARRHLPMDKKTAEAALMDWADDIAYSVHDMEDFHRANLVPWAFIMSDSKERADIVDETVGQWCDPPAGARSRIEEALDKILTHAKAAELYQPYCGNRAHRERLRWWTSDLIGRFLNAVKLSTSGYPLAINPHVQEEVMVLKQMTWRYAINNPGLAAQQHGHKQLIRQMFVDLMAILTSGELPAFPMRHRHLAEDVRVSRPRVVADCISSMTESEALALHKRLRGISAGTFLDPIVR